MRRPARTILAIVLAISALAIAASAAVASGGSSAAPPLADGDTHGPAGTGTTAPPVRACGTPHVQGDGPDGTVSIDVCDDPPPILPEPHVVVPTPGMVDVHPVPFQSRRRSEPDGRTLADRLRRRHRTVLGPRSRRRALRRGRGDDHAVRRLRIPSAGQVACIMIAEFKRVIVHLDQPLGDRTIVDGAKTGIREG